MHDNIIQDGYVVGRQENSLRNKPTQVLYLVGKVSTINTNRAIAACFSGDLPDYLLFPDTALFESLEALQKRQQELYLLGKGAKLHDFI